MAAHLTQPSLRHALDPLQNMTCLQASVNFRPKSGRSFYHQIGREKKKIEKIKRKEKEKDKVGEGKNCANKFGPKIDFFSQFRCFSELSTVCSITNFCSNIINY